MVWMAKLNCLFCEAINEREKKNIYSTSIAVGCIYDTGAAVAYSQCSFRCIQ